MRTGCAMAAISRTIGAVTVPRLFDRVRGNSLDCRVQTGVDLSVRGGFRAALSRLRFRLDRGSCGLRSKYGRKG